MNPTIALMNARSSTRACDAAPLSDEEKQAILHASMRAPTAGNLMLYSIIEIEDQALKDRLAVTCDDQPFIARAPWVLVFVADYQKWIDLFAVSGVDRLPGVRHRGAPGPGDLLLACSDALIAAQNAVIAAESLGIGSCYIGDVLEQAEEHAELLGLPDHTLPIAMLCFGRPAKPRPPLRTTSSTWCTRTATAASAPKSCAKPLTSSRSSTRRAAFGRASRTSARTSTCASTPRASPTN